MSHQAGTPQRRDRPAHRFARLRWPLACLLLVAVAGACGSLSSAGAPAAGSAATRTEATAGPGQATARFVVPTIECPSCPARIRASAKKDLGVIDVAVDSDTQRVTIIYDPAKTDPERMAAAIRKGGDTVLPGD